MRFAPILYFSCEDILIVTLKNKEKKFRGFNKNDFKIFYKTKKTFKHNFFIFIIYKTFLGSREIPHEIGPDRFSRFDVYWIQTNRQTSQIDI